MYHNVLEKKVYKSRFREIQNAAKHRREPSGAGLGRRDLMKRGLATAAGTLLPIQELAARNSPGSISVCVASSRPFIELMPMMPIDQPLPRLTALRRLSLKPTRASSGLPATSPSTFFRPRSFTKFRGVQPRSACIPRFPWILYARLTKEKALLFLSPSCVSRDREANLVRDSKRLPSQPDNETAIGPVPPKRSSVLPDTGQFCSQETRRGGRSCRQQKVNQKIN
jgi:hypothetical protein